MGLTFQQKFGYLPKTVYMVLDDVNPPEICGIIEVPDNKEEEIELLKKITQEGYLVQLIDFDDLVLKGLRWKND